MYIYCIKPDGLLKCNFIKIGFSEYIESLNKRYSTYYGCGCKYYYVEIFDKKCEHYLHVYLKELGLHLKNELYICNKTYNFYYYITILEKININFGKKIDKRLNKNNYNNNIKKYNYKSRHFFDFLIHYFNKKSKDVKYKVILKNINKFDVFWNEYILFCNIISNKIFKNKDKFNEFIQIMKLDNIIKYKNFLILIENDKIIIKKI